MKPVRVPPELAERIGYAIDGVKADLRRMQSFKAERRKTDLEKAASTEAHGLGWSQVSGLAEKYRLSSFLARKALEHTGIDERKTRGLVTRGELTEIIEHNAAKHAAYHHHPRLEKKLALPAVTLLAVMHLRGEKKSVVNAFLEMDAGGKRKVGDIVDDELGGRKRVSKIVGIARVLRRILSDEFERELAGAQEAEPVEAKPRGP